ncbi:hypothetical protein DYB34_012767, partial [Aphanomyces astaci]
DRYVVQVDSDAVFASVLDGHGGWQVAEYVNQHLIDNAATLLHDAAFNNPPASNDPTHSLLSNAFVDTDDALRALLLPAFQLGFGLVNRVGACTMLAYAKGDTLVVANDAYDFVEFVVQHMTLQFGAQTRHRLQGLITALEQYCIKDTWVFAFCRFCGIAEQLPSDCFTFYVSALQCLQFAVPNRAQQADYYIPSDVFYPLFVKKAVMALRTIASDANIDEAKWYATLRECRVLCPRKSVLGSPIYVVGLGAFMDLVLDIWLSNRRTMEDEMRRMFVQFDTDQSKSLSYDEFRAFIVHCHKTLQESASTRQSFCQRVVDEKNVVKLYGKCLMQSDQSEINIDSFVLGGMESMCLSTRCST